MIQASTGLSTNAHSVQAAVEAGREALDGLNGAGADWCVAFVTAEHAESLPALLGALAENVGTPYVVGCSAAGVMAGDAEIETGPGVAVLAISSDKLRATPFLFQDEGDHGLTAGVRLGQRLMSSRNSRDLVLVWPDPFHIHPRRLLEGIDATLTGLPVAGAASSARGADTPTFQFSGAESAAAAVSGVRLGGEFRYRVGVSQGCRKLGAPVRVTRAHDNLILEIENRPALDVIQERSPALTSRDGQTRCALFVGPIGSEDTAVAGGDDYVLRNVVAIDPDTGVIAITSNVEEGQHVALALQDSGVAQDDLRRVVDDTIQGTSPEAFSFGLYFNCLARGRSLYDRGGVDAEIISSALPGVPVLGVFGNAEIAPHGGANRILMHSGVLVLVGE